MSKHQVTAYVSEAAITAIRAVAERERRSVSQWAAMVLERAVDTVVLATEPNSMPAADLGTREVTADPQARTLTAPAVPTKPQPRFGQKPVKPTGTPCFMCGCRGGSQQAATCRLFGCACHKAVG